MCTALIADIPLTVGAALLEIEDQSKTFQERMPADFAVGPFSVFNSSVSTLSSNLPHDCGSGTTLSVDNNASQSHYDTTTFELGNATSPIYFLDSLQWADLFTWDTGFQGDNHTHQWSNAPQPGPSISTDKWKWQAGNTSSPHNADAGSQKSPRDASAEDILWPDLDLIGDASFLLSHFNDHVITQMGSLPIHEKSPWRILNLQSATVTLSQLTVLKTERSTIRHANLSNFFALIAVSAFHLSVCSSTFEGSARTSGYWEALSSRTYNAAKHHLKLSLETEYRAPGKAKYKEQLMALHAVLATSLLSGNEKDARHYLTQQERLIRLRGLPKQLVSRRARLLHHVYAWMRIVSESTNVLHQDAPINEESSIESSNTPVDEQEPWDKRTQTGRGRGTVEVTLDNFLRLDPHQSDSDLNIDSQKDPGSSVRDIHLEDSRQGQDSMFMEIYGVPETWLSLVSQTTRLANVMDRLAIGKCHAGAETLASLQLRASRLENAICSFVSGSHSDSQIISDGVGGERDKAERDTREMTPHIHMIRALSSALVIFFYRRIRNINPWILQTSVTDVIDSLHAFDSALERQGLPGPGTAWPAFIAGAEATSRRHREQIISWLDKAFLKSGFMSYRVSGEILTEVWKRRDESVSHGPRQKGQESEMAIAATSLTWVNVCRDMNCWPMLC